jgi:hypothetical protein
MPGKKFKKDELKFFITKYP